MPPLVLRRAEARRLAVTAQLLSAPRPSSLIDSVRHLGGIQIDPTSTVARTEQLVLWSRLGRFDPSELERELREPRRLFEYRAFILPMVDFAIHRETMRRYPSGRLARGRYIREWLAANAAFRRYILRRLKEEGPLRSGAFDDRAEEPWRTGGWNDGKNVSRMLEILCLRGEVTTVGREGNERIWDLAVRWLPFDEPRRPPEEIARQVLERQLRCRGIARISQFGLLFDGRPPGWERALKELLSEGVVVPVRVEDLAGEWFAHRDLLGARFHPRTVLLSPFDPLIADRTRTEHLLSFRMRLEIYVPKHKRRFGYYVMPILRGDRLIGRIDPTYERDERCLRLNAVYAEPDPSPAAGDDVAKAIRNLARWLGAQRIVMPQRVPSAWRPALTEANR